MAVVAVLAPGQAAVRLHECSLSSVTGSNKCQLKRLVQLSSVPAHHGRLSALQWMKVCKSVIEELQFSKRQSSWSCNIYSMMMSVYNDVIHMEDTPSMPDIATTMDSIDLNPIIFSVEALICSVLFTLALSCLATDICSCILVHTACASTMAAEYDKATLLDVSCSYSRGRRWTTHTDGKVATCSS